ncbi:uncharacterized protein [Mytilus edulis]|uniref:uncharacterized protein n=1 Tax=Mytilus edulis TaxID=6550 RepID=UPI0039EE56BE
MAVYGYFCGSFFCFGMFIFQIVNVGVGYNCKCPFGEGVPKILQICGAFGAVLFGSVFIAYACCANSECLGIFFKGLVGINILVYVICLFAAAATTFNNFSRWSLENQANCDCFNYTSGMVITNCVFLILAAIVICSTKNSS